MAFSYPKRKRGKAALLLEDGSLYPGSGIGAYGGAIGELCFNTSMSGYQEILSDPSYAEQIIVFSFPHIGNVGVCRADDESDKVYARGCIFAQKPSERSSWRSEDDLNAWLTSRGVIALYGLDTRALVRRLRDEGAQKAAIINEPKATFSKKIWLKKIQNWAGLLDTELAREVGSKQQYRWQETNQDKDDKDKASQNKAGQDKVDGDKAGEGKVSTSKVNNNKPNNNKDNNKITTRITTRIATSLKATSSCTSSRSISASNAISCAA